MTGHRERAALRLGVVAGLVTLVVGCAGEAGAPAPPAPRPDPDGTAVVVADPAEEPEVAVLTRWDARRAAAYARGDTRALRRLYTDGSRAGRADVAMLREYVERGLRVERMRTQLLALEVLGVTPERMRLRVTDRLAGAVAVGRGRRLRLPRDEPSRHVVTLRRESGRPWQVTSVR